MADELTVEQTDNHVTVLRLQGHLHANTEGTFMDYVHRAKDSGARFLLIDLSGVEVISSAGLRALHNGFKMFTPTEEVEKWQNEHPSDIYKSPYFKLAGASGNVYYILNLAGFLHNIPIFPTMQEALDSFEK